MFRLERTDAKSIQFQDLVKALDAGLAIVDGDDHEFYHQFNGIDNIQYVVLGYVDHQAVACGAIKKFNAEYMEVKRMYVKPAYRGNAYALDLLKELEQWSRAVGYTHCILETGRKQTAAINLYEKADYEYIDNYDQYAGVKNSLCFRKKL